MARAWDRALFHTEELFPGADVYTRRSLGMINRNNPNVNRVLEAAKLLGLKAQSPYWKVDAWAHIGFYTLKVAVIVRSHIDNAFVSKLRERWARHRWKVFFVSERQLERMDVQGVKEELQAAFLHVRKVGGR